VINSPDVKFDTLDVRLDDGVYLGSKRRHTRALREEPIDSRQNHAINVLDRSLNGNVLLDRDDGNEVMAILHERDQLETRWSRRRVTHSIGLLVVKAVDVVRPRQYIIPSLTKALDDWVVECLIGYMDLQRVFDARVSYLRVESKTLVYQKFMHKALTLIADVSLLKATYSSIVGHSLRSRLPTWLRAASTYSWVASVNLLCMP